MSALRRLWVVRACSLWVLCVVLRSGVASAQPQANCAVPGTTVTYVNGMFNDLATAQDGLIGLRALHPDEALDSGGNAVYELAYNYNETPWEQMLQVVRQKALEDPARFWRLLARKEALPAWFTDTLAALTKQAGTALSYLLDEDLRRHVANYINHLVVGRRVLIVSHSQGNFYANSAALLLRADYGKSIGNVQVATPASVVETGGPWSTFADDLPMLAVRSLAGSLPANLPGSGAGVAPVGDPVAHEFLKAYLRLASDKIAADMLSVLSTLEYPSAFVACAPPSPPGTAALASGDPHLLTFDGARYDAQAKGEETLVISESGDLEVQIRTQQYAAKNVAIIGAVAARVGGDVVALYTDRDPVLNHAPTTFGPGKTALAGGGAVWKTTDGWVLAWPDSTQLRVGTAGSFLNVRVFLAPSRMGQVTGLLGNANGTTADDLAIRGSSVALASPVPFATLYGTYLESWRVTQGTSLFDYRAGESTATFTDRSFPSQLVSAADVRDPQRQAATTICNRAGVTGDWLDACILDVGLSDGDARFASALALAPAGTAAIDVGPANDVPTAGLVAWYRSTQDLSSPGNSLTVVGAVTTTTDRFGTPNVASSFPASTTTHTNYLTLANPTALPTGAAARTISVWFKTSSTTAQSVLNWGNGGINGARCGITTLNTANAVGQFADINGSITVTDGKWHNVIVSFDGTTIFNYVDNRYSNAGNPSPAWNTSAGFPFNIGGAPANHIPEPFDGAIDDVRVYDRVLSDQERAALFHEGGW